MTKIYPIGSEPKKDTKPKKVGIRDTTNEQVNPVQERAGQKKLLEQIEAN